MKEKDEQFAKLWDSTNPSKRDQFRNLMRSKLEARNMPFTRENALRFWSGEHQPAPPREGILGEDRGYRSEGGGPRGRRPPRRGPRGASHRTTSRSSQPAPEGRRDQGGH